MLLYMMLCIMHAYIMLLAALSNAVYLHNDFLAAIDFCIWFLFSCIVMLCRQSLFILSMIFHHAQCF